MTGPDPGDRLTPARELVDALLGLSKAPLIETGEPDPPPPELGALGGWRFESPAPGVEADVYVFDTAEGIAAAAGRLLERSGPADERGLPAVGTNGGLVYVVRPTAADPTVEEAYAALGVASALAGRER
jgi:hypothetical protein